MVKIIDSYRDIEYPYIHIFYLSLLGDRSYYPIKLSKQRNFKNIFIGSDWRRQYDSWQPLGFERNIVYK